MASLSLPNEPLVWRQQMRILDALKISGERLSNSISTSKLTGTVLEVVSVGRYPHPASGNEQVVTPEDINVIHGNFQRYKNACNGAWNGIPLIGNMSVGHPHGDDGPAFAWAIESRIANNASGSPALFLDLEMTPLGKEHLGSTFKEFSQDWIGQRLANGEWHPVALINIACTNNAVIKTNRLTNADGAPDWKSGMSEIILQAVGDAPTLEEALRRIDQQYRALNAKQSELNALRQLVETMAAKAGIRDPWCIRAEDNGDFVATVTRVGNSLVSAVDRLVDLGFDPIFKAATNSRLANAGDRDRLRNLYLSDPQAIANLLPSTTPVALPNDPLTSLANSSAARIGGGAEKVPTDEQAREMTRLANSMPGSYDANFPAVWEEFQRTGAVRQVS